MAHHHLLSFLSLNEFLPLSYPATWWPMPHETLQSCHGDGCQAQFVVRVQLLRKASHLLYRFGWYIYMYTIHIYIYPVTVPKGSAFHLTMVMGRLPSKWNGLQVISFAFWNQQNPQPKHPRKKVQFKRKHAFGKLDYICRYVYRCFCL